MRDKPPSMIDVSAKATVPVLLLPDDRVIDESLDVMLYALKRSDPENLLNANRADLDDMLALIGESDGPFKTHLDHYKYPNRYENIDAMHERSLASEFLTKLNQMLADNGEHLFGSDISLADMAILPFVRQFANVDKQWFDAQNWPELILALDAFVSSERFLSIMNKYPQWHEGDEPTYFGMVT